MQINNLIVYGPPGTNRSMGGKTMKTRYVSSRCPNCLNSSAFWQAHLQSYKIWQALTQVVKAWLTCLQRIPYMV